VHNPFSAPLRLGQGGAVFLFFVCVCVNNLIQNRSQAPASKDVVQTKRKKKNARTIQSQQRREKKAEKKKLSSQAQNAKKRRGRRRSAVIKTAKSRERKRSQATKGRYYVLCEDALCCEFVLHEKKSLTNHPVKKKKEREGAACTFEDTLSDEICLPHLCAYV
jgi:type IV secretory pathway VirB10-like protein